MRGLANLNLINFLDFYFMFMFLVSTLRRIGQYRAFGQLVLSWPGRWPNLLKLISEHRTILMTWATVLPTVLALILWLAQILASRLVWPEAGQPATGLTISDLLQHWVALAAIVPLGLAMLAVDVLGVVRLGQINQEELEKYFDQAEYWLKSRTAHVVKVFTLGYINPRRMVTEEVQKALVGASALVNNTMWWVSLQIGLRVAFGLSLWFTWAVNRG